MADSFVLIYGTSKLLSHKLEHLLSRHLLSGDTGGAPFAVAHRPPSSTSSPPERLPAKPCGHKDSSGGASLCLTAQGQGGLPGIWRRKPPKSAPIGQTWRGRAFRRLRLAGVAAEFGGAGCGGQGRQIRAGSGEEASSSA